MSTYDITYADPYGAPPYVPVAYGDALVAGHVVVTRAHLLQGGVPKRLNLPVIGGSVDIDGDAAVRRRCSLTMVTDDPSLLPLEPTSMVSPFGAELALYRGTVDDLYPLGVFRVDHTSLAHGPAGTISLDGNDRSVSVSSAGIDDTYVIPAGTNFTTAIGDLLSTVLPGIIMDLAATDIATPAVMVLLEGDDPWEAAQEMARSIGMLLHFDSAGRAVLRPAPTGLPVAEYVAGEDSTMVSLTTDMYGTAFNRIVVVSAGNAPVVRAAAQDDNPTSPTYYGGIYGRRSKVVRSEKVGTVAQAQAMADALLAGEMGRTERASIAAIPDARRDAGDIVRIAVPEAGYDALAIVTSATIPLGYDQLMDLTTRRLR